MGYRPKKKIYDLKFEDPDMDGLEVKLRGLNTGQVLQADEARTEGGDDRIHGLLRMYADQLVAWNIEDEDGKPLPMTIDAVLGLDLDFNMKIIDTWRMAIAGVPAPLDSDSLSGEPSLEASIPMDVPSESLAS
jgi:hypothetical protein